MPKNREKAKVVSIDSKKTPVDEINKRKANCIRAYIKAGYPLFQCVGKKPRKGTNGSKTEYDESLTPKDFPGNYGIALKPDDLIIDADPRAYPTRRSGRIARWDGGEYKGPMKLWQDCQADTLVHLREGEFDNSLHRFLKDMGYQKDIDTYIVKSGSGGYHVHLKIQVTARTADRLTQYPGLEFKRYPAYLVGPYSIHPDTNKPYKKLRGSLDEVLEANDKIIEALEKEEIPNDENGFDAYDDDDEETIRLLTEVIKLAPPATQHDYGDDDTIKVAMFGHDWGVSPEAMHEIMLEHWNERCSPPWGDEELLYKIKSAYKSARGALGNKNPKTQFAKIEFDFDEIEGIDEPEDTDPLRVQEERLYDRFNFEKGGVIKENDLSNTMAYLTTPDQDLYRIYRYNEMKNCVEYTKSPPWQKYGDTPIFDKKEQIVLRSWFETERHYAVSEQTVYAAVTAVTKRLYSFHPIRDYLNELKWDGVNRLETVLSDYAGCQDTKLTQEVSKNTLLAAVNRAMIPGCKCDQVLILEGTQGNKKGTFLEVLSKGFSTALTLNLKDEEKMVQKLNGVWLVELPEVDQYTSKYGEQQSNKDFITRRLDRTRLPWEPNAQDYKRQGIIIGTCNAMGGRYLSDDTGNRRYWPVTTGKFRLKALEKVVDQIWAEAVHRFREGERYWIEESEMKELAREEVLKRTMRDPWQDILRDHLDNWEAEEADDESEQLPLTPKHLMSNLGLRINDRNSYARLLNLMTHEGYVLKNTPGKSSVFVKERDFLLEGIFE